MIEFANPAAYECWMGRWSTRLAPAMVAFADLPGGARLLDVGSGTGALAHALVESVADATVVGIEPAAEFVARCRETNTDPRLRFETGDALAIPFPDASFDATLSLLILQELPDVPLALSEMRRVTRPSGPVVASQWDFADGMPMLSLFWDAVLEVAPGAASREAAARCMEVAYPDGAALERLWRETGLVEVATERHDIDMTFASFDDYWRPFLSNVSAASSFAGTLGDDQRSALERRLRRTATGAAPGGPFTLKAHAWAVRGRVPAR
ncbi:MAG: class I SAM-dependent methyltransferase [Paracoccaceae bacterium]